MGQSLNEKEKELKDMNQRIHWENSRLKMQLHFLIEEKLEL